MKRAKDTLLNDPWTMSTAKIPSNDKAGRTEYLFQMLILKISLSNYLMTYRRPRTKNAFRTARLPRIAQARPL